MHKEDLDRLGAILQRRSGLALTADKAYLVEGRLAPLARCFGFGDVGDLLRHLHGNPDESLLAAITEAMTTNESSFFRDGRPFEYFSRTILPRLLAERSSERRLRIWSTAAATGQEAYSLAMCVEEAGIDLTRWSVEIVATDIAEHALDRARQGLYTQFEVQRGLSVQRLVRWFTQEPQGWRIKDRVARRVRFAKHNLLSDCRSLGRFDVVFARNVLIYFDVATKRRVVSNLSRVIADDGFLVLGGTETMLGVSDRFVVEPEERSVYRPSTARPRPDRASGPGSERPFEAVAGRATGAGR